MAELTLIIIDLAAGHAKLIGTEPRALPGRSSNWQWAWLACHFACNCMRAGAVDHQGTFCHRPARLLTTFPLLGRCQCPLGPDAQLGWDDGCIETHLYRASLPLSQRRRDPLVGWILGVATGADGNELEMTASSGVGEIGAALADYSGHVLQWSIE